MARGTESIPGDRKSWLQGGGLVFAVVAVLLFAGARQVDPRVTATRPAPAPRFATPPVQPDEPHEAPSAARHDASRPVLDPLSRRTLEDPVRLARAGAFTLQIAVACRKETALRLLDRAPNAEDLYVLPAVSRGQECYRFCWGAFDGRERALRAALPASLRSADLGTPAPRRIAELTP